MATTPGKRSRTPFRAGDTPEWVSEISPSKTADEQPPISGRGVFRPGGLTYVEENKVGKSQG